MLDAVGNVLSIGDIVMVAAGARSNRNNSSLTPCRIFDISGNRCLVGKAVDIVTAHNKMDVWSWSEWRKGNGRVAWKFPRQVVKVEKFISKI